MDNIQGLATSANNIAHEYLELQRENAGDRLALLLASKGDIGETLEALDDYKTLLDAVSIHEGEEDESDIYKLFTEVRDDSNKVKILPGNVNAVINGGVRRPCSIAVFGRPNSGKSLLSINACAGFLAQGLRVLYIENEDALVDTRARMVQRITQMTEPEIKSDPERAVQLAMERGYDRFILKAGTPGTVSEIAALTQRHKADVIVVNQIRNIQVRGGGDASPTQKLDKAAQQLRTVAKMNNAILWMVTQAKDPGSDKDGRPKERPVLYMEDVDSSHTGLPGACDLMLGYGVTPDMHAQKMACITIAKSKYGGDRESVYVRVVPEIDKLVSGKR
jgi:archaellum biogenesis ATPase FlaH